MAALGAAPHLPAGILSPYRDGERGALIAGFANHRCCRRNAGIRPAHLSPFYGERCPGRTVRGSADGKISLIRRTRM
ncbi:MAG: hypothetical protein EOS27_28225 [Mesorhizobium sp.]|nr:MAG: hypothetical protein EOS27_28225 [Mesorhizobium sp.]TIX22993.1 MAG: hypothetical protein E5V35_23855 [Mesorhizobium sp.]